MSNARNIANLPNGDDAPLYACRAFVNFNGNSGTAGDNKTINDSNNVTSVYEVSAGIYTISFESEMPDANYIAIYGGCIDGTLGTVGCYVGTDTQSGVVQTKSSTQLKIRCAAMNTNTADTVDVSVAIFH